MTSPGFDEYYDVFRLWPTLGFSGDRHVVYVSNVAGKLDLWRADVVTAERAPLTRGSNLTVRSTAVSPDGRIVAFSADEAGRELTGVYAVPAAGGPVEELEGGAGVECHLGAGSWAPDGRRLAFVRSDTASGEAGIWARGWPGGERRMLAPVDGWVAPGSWSATGERFLATRLRTLSHSTLLVVDAVSGGAREVALGDDRTRVLAGPWLPGGDCFYALTDLGRDFLGLALFDAEAGFSEWVETPAGDVEEVALSGDGSTLAWIVNEQGWSMLRTRRLDGEPLPEPRLPRGCVPAGGSALCLSPDGSRLALLWGQPHRPPEVYVADLASGSAVPVTSSTGPGFARVATSQPELIHYRTFDERRIPAWLYRTEARDPTPVLLYVHGGPAMQERPAYRAMHQYLRGRGISVLAPNIRGSTGYGKPYQRLVEHDWGGGDVSDLVAAVMWLRGEAWADPGRIGLYGGSYGGFAVLSCLARAPELWAAGVSLFGPSNLLNLVRSAPPVFKALSVRELGDPDTERDFLLSRSPITQVEHIRAPLLLIGGARDRRVPRADIELLADRLRSLGRTVECVIFDDEGHGVFTRRENELRAYRLAADWLERHLLGGAAAATGS